MDVNARIMLDLFVVLYSDVSRIAVVVLLMYGLDKCICLPHQGLRRSVCVWMEIFTRQVQNDVMNIMF